MLGLFGELELAPSHLFERVVRRVAFLAATRGHPGSQLERAQLLVGERLARERVVLAAVDHRPAQADKLASGRDDRDLRAAPGADTFEERAQRPGDLRGGERGFDEHPARVRTALLGDPSVRRGLAAGLAHPRVEPEIGDQLLGSAEAREVADRRCECERDGRVDAGDRHQPLDVLAFECDPAQGGVDDSQLLGLEVKLAQQRLDRLPLIPGEVLLCQPGASFDPEQVGERAARDQVAMQNRLHLVLQAGALTHDVRAPSDLTPQRVRRLISNPHARQIVGGQQLREDRRVDLVGLDLRLSDRPGLHRVRDHHPGDPRRDRAHQCVRVARRLDRDLILAAETVDEHRQRLAGDRDLPSMANLPVLPHRDLREIAMHVESDASTSHDPTS